jgi:hypothetical protein
LSGSESVNAKKGPKIRGKKTVGAMEKRVMRRPGIEPGPSAWKADILTTRPTTLRVCVVQQYS